MTQDVQQLPDAQSGLTRRCTQAAAAPQQQLHWQPGAEAAGCSSESGTSADLDVVLLDEHDSSSSDAKLKRQLLMSGVITALGIALHNFPEGVAVFLAAQKSPAIGEAARHCAQYNYTGGVGLARQLVHASCTSFYMCFGIADRTVLHCMLACTLSNAAVGYVQLLADNPVVPRRMQG
jgi:hypothetical protein